MTNRTGKHEREARNRHKRPWVESWLRNGTYLPPLKLGRKKYGSFFRASRFAKQWTCSSYLYVGSGPPEYMSAVPVTEAESQERNGRSVGDVSEPESSPASGQDQS